LNYRWTFKKPKNEETTQYLRNKIKIPKSLATVLANRGIENETQSEKFFNPSLNDLHDPYLMLNMRKAVDRVLLAREKGQCIWVHGDYDVDGTSSTALAVLFLREIGLKIHYFIPDRFIDGFGLSCRSVDLAKEKNCSIMISVDVGMTAIEPLRYAKEQGIDTIVCDHHQTGDETPDTFAILNPIQKNCEYPFKHLAACGVVFKLIQAINKDLNRDKESYKYLDFVALASAADMVPLLDENRAMVQYGIDLINKNPRPGFKGLIHCTRLDFGSITASNSVFAMAPIINAAGRMGAAMRSVEMMISKEEISAFQIAQQLEDENRKRRIYDLQTFEEAIPLAEEKLAMGKKALVLHKKDWHLGVIGIVASRLVDKFNVPTFLLTSIDGIAKGSTRSANHFDVYSALKSASHLLIEYGGHRHAAGLTIADENLDEFEMIIDKIANGEISNEMLVPDIQVDAELTLSDLSPNFLKKLSQFAPYGFENNKPVFYTKGVKSANGIKIVGQNNLKFRALHSNFVIDAIGYGLADKYKICASGKPFSIVYHIEINSQYSDNLPQLFIKDIREE